MSRRRKRRPPRALVHFIDEAPRLGSGRRLVEILSVGRKWVRLRDPWTKRVQRLPRKVWDSLGAQERGK